MAATSTRRIKNAPYRVNGVILLAASFRPLATALTTPDAEISKDGGSFNDCSDEAHDIGTTGFFYVDLTAAETACDHITFVQKCADADTIYFIEKITFEPAADSGVAQSATSSSIVLRASATATDDYYNGLDIEIVDGTGKGQVRRITDYVGSTVTATIDRGWATNPDSTSVYIVHPRTGPGLNTYIDANADVRCAGGYTSSRSDIGDSAAYGMLANLTSFVNGGTPSTTSFITGLSSTVTDAYKNGVLTFSSGALRGESAEITAYNGSTKAVTLTPALSAAPADQDKFIISGLFV